MGRKLPIFFYKKMIDFNKITSNVDSNFVLSKIDAATIFSNYFGHFDMRKVYPSKFRKDKSPSTGFYINKHGEIIYNDLATGEKLNCFAFVAKLHNISYFNAIKKVAQDFGLIYSNKYVPISKEIFKLGAEVDLEAKQKTLIQFIPDVWSEKYLTYWRTYEVTEEELIREKIFPVKRLFVNKKEIWSKNGIVRFAKLVKFEGEEYVKIYSPKDKNMKWISNIPLTVPFDFEELPHESRRIFITKSFKDAVVLKKLFTDVIATQNESESALSPKIQLELIKNYDEGIIIFDNDSVGVENCKKFNDKGFGYFNIPYHYYEKYNIKDCSDYVAFFGVDALRELFKEKQLL